MRALLRAPELNVPGVFIVRGLVSVQGEGMCVKEDADRGHCDIVATTHRRSRVFECVDPPTPRCGFRWNLSAQGLTTNDLSAQGLTFVDSVNYLRCQAYIYCVP